MMKLVILQRCVEPVASQVSLILNMPCKNSQRRTYHVLGMRCNNTGICLTSPFSADSFHGIGTFECKSTYDMAAHAQRAAARLSMLIMTAQRVLVVLLTSSDCAEKGQSYSMYTHTAVHQLAYNGLLRGSAAFTSPSQDFCHGTTRATCAHPPAAAATAGTAALRPAAVHASP